MMARQHVPLSGLATLTIVSTLGGVNPFIPMQGIPLFAEMSDPATLFVLTLIGQAFGMVPDIDHPNSTITKKLGVVGSILHPIISTLSGGHRKGAHSWVFVVAMAMVGGLLTSLSDKTMWPDGFASAGIWITALFVTLCTAFSIRLILPQKLNKSGKFTMLVSLVGGATVLLNPQMMDTPWLIFAMALGTLFHDVGDMMTTGMVPFLWPFIDKPLGIPVVGRTGSIREVFAVGPLLTFGLAASYAMLILKPGLPMFQNWLSATSDKLTQGFVDIPSIPMDITLYGALIVAGALAIFDLATRIFFPPRFQGGH